MVARNENLMQFWWGFRYAWLGLFTLGRGKQSDGSAFNSWFFWGYTLAAWGMIVPLVVGLPLWVVAALMAA
jgi:hypothetical protein